MADFYDYLDDLDLDFDPDDPTDPLNALLEQIREDMEDTSPKAYSSNMTMLLGNHEQMCLSTLGPRSEFGAKDLWRMNGGMPTYRELLYRRTHQERHEILRFLSGLPDLINLEVGGQKFCLVHGYPGDDHDTRIWGRVDTDSKSPFPDTICIVGHTPTVFLTNRHDEDLSIWYGEGILDIDCGCGNRDAVHRRLACLRLEDMAEFYVGGATAKYD